MKQAFLDDAKPQDVSRAVRDVLERRGALVTEHVSTHVRFAGLTPKAVPAWDREGYVGIYQPLGEKEVQVRVTLRARWPWRILWSVALVNVLVALVVFVTNPAGTTWVLAAFVTGLALLVAGLLHLNTLKPVREEERDLMQAFEEEWRRDLPAVQVVDALAREEQEAEAQLEGDVMRIRVQRARRDEAKLAPRAAKGSRFSLKPAKKDAAPVESAEAKRARLLARKAELEAQKSAGDKGQPPS